MKKTKQFLFESQLKWLTETKGIITSEGINEPVKVSTPKVFKGQEAGLWSPEHLLISSVSAGVMTTYMFYAKQKLLSIAAFECEAIGQVDLVNGKLNFTTINVYPVVGVEKEEYINAAKEVMELTTQNCLVARTLNAPIYYHPDFEVITHPFENKLRSSDKKREVFF